jgi:hypothetical protein
MFATETRQMDGKNRFISGALLNSEGKREPLTEAQLRHAAPSIFAEGKHESRSERYAYIPTIEPVRALVREGFRPVYARQGNSRIEGKREFTKHLIRFQHDTALMQAHGDIVPEVILINSHDGTSSYVIMAGAFRGICYNGLYSADLIDDFKVGHSGNVVNKVIDGTWRVVDNVGRITEKASEWNEIVLTPDEQGVFAEAAHELRFDNESSAATINPRRLLLPHRPEDRGNDLWRTFNRVQENVTKGGISYTSTTEREDGTVVRRNLETRPINNIDGDTKLNRALWTLTQKMAELKAA